MTTGKFTLVIRWPSGQSTICGEMTDHQYGEICRILLPDYRAQLPSQGGEAVAVVAYIDGGGAIYTAKLLEIMSVELDGCEQLMTVAQHQRIMAALTPPSPNADLVELLRAKFPRIDPCQPVPLDEKAHCCEYTIYVERERLHRLIDAKLASLEVKP